MAIILYRRGREWTLCSCDAYDEAIRLRDHEMVRICATCGKIIGLVGVAAEVCPCHCISHGTCGKCGEAALANIAAGGIPVDNPNRDHIVLVVP